MNERMTFPTPLKGLASAEQLTVQGSRSHVSWLALPNRPPQNERLKAISSYSCSGGCGAAR